MIHNSKFIIKYKVLFFYCCFIQLCCAGCGARQRADGKKPNQLYIHKRIGSFDALIYRLNKTRQSVLTIGHPALEGERSG